PMPAGVDGLSEPTEITAATAIAAGDDALAAILSQPVPAGESDATPADGGDGGDRAATTDATDAPGSRPASAAEPRDLLEVVAAQSGGADLRTLGDDDAGDSRVVLVASEPSWVQVKSRSSDYVWTRTLEPGDAYFVPGDDELALWTGNAGGLKVVVDGEPLAPLGEPGQVRRDIPLAADVLSAQYARD
ncbi:MAG: DUF4115 domain-containing protein, partial [Alphaproteobacteria bacterium]